MQIWITFVLINIIHQTHVSAAPLVSNFGKIADAIINPAWALNNPGDSSKKDNKNTDLNKKNNENLPNTTDSDIDYPNTKNNKKNNSRKKNKKIGKKGNINKKRRNKRRRNNTRRTGRYLWYSVFTMDDLLVNLPEYRNHEDEQKIVLVWDDKRIVQNKHVDALSMNNLNNNQLIRQKRDYKNILEPQDNKLQTRNDNQHVLEENENSMSSNSNENINENMKFLNLRNSNTNKFKNILQNKKQPTNTIKNKISRPNHAQDLGITLGADNSEKEGSQLKIIEENRKKINAITTLSNDKSELIIKENTGIDKNTPEIDKIDTLINRMNSNSEEGADDDQDSESYPSSMETKNGIPNYSEIEDNKQHDILKNIRHPFKPKSRKLEKQQPKNNDKGTLQTRFKPNAPSKNHRKTPSIDIPEHKTKRNIDIAKNIPVNDEIDTLINTMNSNSEEDSSSENSDSNTSSLEKKQDILDFSDLGDNKEKNLLKSIKQPLKPILKIQGKTLLENNEKQPEIYEKYLNNPSKINTKNEKGYHQKGNTSSSISINNQQTPPINVPGHITPEHTGITKNIPENDEIETLMNAINSNSKEGADDQNSEPYPSLETKQEIPNYSDVEDNKQHDILKNIKHPFKPKSRKLEKKQPKNIDKGTVQTRFTANAPSINHQKKPSTDITEHKTEGNTDIAKNIPVNDEIDTLINTMNSNSKEGADDQNSEPYPSLETKQEIPNYSDVEDNKQHDILKNIKHPFKLKSRKLEKKQPKNIDKGTVQTRFTTNAPSINHQKKPSTDITEHKTEGNTDIAKNIPMNDEIETLMNAINSNSEEDSFSQNSDSNPLSLEKQQDILDFSDLGENKENNFLKTIKQPLKPMSKTQGKKLLENNEKLPEIYKQKFDNTLEIYENSEERPQQKTLTPKTQNLDEDKIKSTIVNDNFKPNIIQKKKSIKPPDLVDTIVPKTTHKIKEFSTKIPLKDIDVSDSLEDLNNLKSITMEDDNVEKIKDKPHSSAKVYNNKKDHDSIHKNINQPILKIPNTENSNTDYSSNDSKMKNYTPPTSKNTEKYSKHSSESQRKKKLDDTSDLNSIDELLSSSINFDEIDLSQPGLKKKKVNPKSKTNNILKNSENKKLKSTLGDNDLKPNIIQKNKLIKIPDFEETIEPETTDEMEEFSIEIPLEDFAVSDELEDPNNTGGMTKKGAAVEKIKDKSSSSELNKRNNEYYKNHLQKIKQNPKRNIHKTSSQTNTVQIPNPLPERLRKKRVDTTSTSNSKEDLLGESLDFNEEDSSQPGLKKKKVIPIATTNDIIKKERNDVLKPTPTNDDDKSNDIQKKKSIKTQDLNDDKTISKSTERVNKKSPESPLNAIDITDPLEEYNNIGGFTMEDVAIEKLKDKPPSTTIDEIPKNLSDGERKKKLVDKLGSNSYNDLLGSSLDFDEEDLSQPGLKKKKVIPIATTNDVIIKNGEDNKLNPLSTNNDDKSNVLQKNKSIKTPDLIDSTVPKSTEKVYKLSTESPSNGIDITDPLEEYNNIGGFTMEDVAIEKLKDKPPSTTVNEIPKNLSDGERKKKLVDKFGSNSYNDLLGSSLDFDEEDLSQPELQKEKVNSMDTTNNIVTKVKDEKLKPIPTNNDDKSNVLQKNKTIKTPDLIDSTVPKPNEKVYKLSTESPSNGIDITDPLEEYNNIGGFTMEDVAIVKPKDKPPSTTIDEIPKNLSDGESKKKLVDKFGSNSYNDLLGSSLDFDEEDLSQPELQKEKVNSMDTTNNIVTKVKDEKLKPIPTNNDDKSNVLQKNKTIKTPDLIDSTVPKSTEKVYKLSTESPSNGIDITDPLEEYNNIGGFTMEDVAIEKLKDKPPSTTIDEIPKNLSDGERKKKLVDKLGLNSYNDLLGSSLDFDEEDLSQPGLKKKKVIPIATTNDVIIKNGEDNKLNPLPTNNDDKSNVLQKNKSIKTPDLIDSTVPKSTEKVYKLTTESPSNGIDITDPLEEYNNIGGFTMEDVAIVKPKDKPPSTTIDEIPKNLSDGESKKKLVDKFGSNSYNDLLGSSLDFDEEDLSQPELQKEKVNSMDTTNNIVTKVKDEKLKPIPTNNDDNSNVLQKNKSIKTPDLIDSTVPKSTEKVYKLSTESPSNGIDITDPLEEYNNLGGFTMEDVAIEKLKDKPPSTTIDEIPKNLSDGERKKKLVEKLGANSYNDLLGSSLDFDEEDLSQPGLKKKKVIPIATTNDVIIKNGEDNKLNPLPTNNDDKSNVLQKNKSIKTPDLIDSTVPKSTEKVYKLTTESPSNGIDITDPLEEYNNIGGFTMEDVAIEKPKDKPPSTTIDEIPKNLSDGERKKKLVDKFGSNSYNDLLGSSLDFDEEDLSQPELQKEKVNSMDTTNNIVTKVKDEKLKPIPTNNDDKSNVLQKNKTIKTPDLIDSTVPKSTEKVYKLSTESPSNGIDITDPLEEYNNIGGFTMEDVAIEKLKDKPPSTTIDEIPKNLSDGERKKKLVDKLGSNSYNDLLGSSLDFDEEDLSQPGLKKKKVIPIATTNDVIIKNGEDNKLNPLPTNNDDKSIVLQKNKSIKTPDFIDSTVPKSTEKVYQLSTESPSNGIDITNPLEEYNNLGGFTMEDVAIEKPKDKPPSTTIDEIPKNLSDGERKKKLVDKFGSNSYNDLLGSSLDFDEEDLSQPELQKEKVNSMDTTNNIVTKVKDEKLKPIPTNNDDNSNVLQKNKSIKTPDLIDNTVPKSTEKVYKLSTESPSNGIDITDPLEEYNNLGGFTMEDVAIEKLKDKPPSTTIDEIPKNLSDGERKKKLVEKLGANSYNDLLGSSLDFDEEDLSQPGLKKKKVIPIATTNDVIIKNGEDNKLNPLPTNNDDKSNVLQKNKSIKTPDLIDSTVPKSTEKVYKLTTESPSNGIDITDPLEEYNNIGGFTMEDVAIEKPKDKPPSTTIDEIPKNLSDGERKKKLVDKFGSNSYNDLLGSSLDFDEEDLSQPELQKEKVNSMDTTNNIVTKVKDEKLKPIPTNNDDKSNVLQKNKTIKTPDLIDSTVPKSTEKVYKLSTESPSNGIDITDPLEEYNNIGGFTMEDVAIEKLKDKPPSTTIDEIPKNLSDGERKKKLVDKLGSNSYNDLLGSSLDFDEEDLSQPGLKKKKVIPIATTNDVIIKNGEDNKLNPLPTNNDDKSIVLQKNKSIKTPDFIDSTVPKSTEKVYQLSTESPSNGIDITNPLEEYNNLGGFTMEDVAIEKPKDKPPSTTIDEIPKNLSDGERKKKLVDKFGSNSYNDLLGSSLDFDEEDLSQPELQKEKVIPIATTNDVIIKNGEDNKLNPLPTNNDDKSNVLQKNKSIKTPDLIDSTVPKSTEKVYKLSTESPSNGIDITDPLEEYNNIGGFTMEDVAIEKLKDKPPSTTIDEIPKNLSDGERKKKLVDKLGSNSYNDLLGSSLDFDEEDLSQPGLKKKKVIPIATTNDVIIKNGEDNKLNPLPTNNDDKSNVLQKNKSIKTPDLIDSTVPKSTEKVYKLSTESPSNGIDITDPLEEYNNIGGFTMEDVAIEKLKDKPLSTTIDETPKNLSDGERKKKLVDKLGLNSYNDLLGSSLDFDEEDLSQPGLKKKKVIPIATTNDVIIKNGEDNKLNPLPTNNDDKSIVLQKNKSIKTPDLIDSTVPKSTEKVYQLSTESPSNVIDITDPLEEYNNIGGFTMEDVAIEKLKDKPPSTTVNEIPKNLSDGERKKKLVDKFGSNSYNDLLGSSLDFDEEDLSQPELQKEKVNSMDTTNNIVTKVNDEKLKPIPTNNDDKSNVLQKNKSIKTPDLIDSTVPKPNEKVYKLSTESPSNGIDITDPLEEYNNIGGFTMEDVAIVKPKDKPPSTTIDEIPKNLSDGESKKKLVDKFGSNSYNDLLGSSLDFDEEDLSQPELQKEKVNSMDTTNNIVTKVKDEKLKPIPTNNDDNSNVLQKNKSIKTPDLIDSTVPKSTEKVYKLSTESPSNGIDITDPLEEYNNLGGFTMEDVAIEKLKDKPPSTTIDEIPKNLSDGERKKKLVDKFGSNSYNDLLGSSLDFDEEDLSQPELQKEKVNSMDTTNNIVTKIKDEKLKPIPTNNDDKSNVLQKNKSIKTPVLIDSTVPESTEKVYKLSTESPSNVIDITDPLEEYNNLGGFTMEDVAIEKLKDKPSSTTIDEIPMNLSDGERKKKLVDKLGSNTFNDLLGSTLDFDEEDLSQPVLQKEKVNSIDTTNNIVTKVKDVKLKPIPTNNDDKSNVLQKNKSIKTPDLIDSTVPKPTEKVYKLSTESPSNGIDITDPLEEYNNIGGFTMEDVAIVKPKDKPPSTTIDEIPKNLSDGESKKKLVDKFGSNSYNNLLGSSLDFDEEDLSQPELQKEKVNSMDTTNNIVTKVKDEKLKPIPTNNDDNSNVLQKNKSIKTPDLIDSTVPKSTENVYKLSTESPSNGIDITDPLEEYNNLGGFTMEDVAIEKLKDKPPSTTIDEIPKNLSDGERKKKLVDKLGSNSYNDLLGSSLDFDEEDLSQPGLKKKKVIPIATTNDVIIKNGEDNKLNPLPTNNDDKSIVLQKNKSIKTPDLIDSTVPKSTEKVYKLSTESPSNGIDITDPLEEYNNLGGFTMEDVAIEKLKDKPPSTTIDEIPKNLSDGERKKKLVDKLGSNTFNDLLGSTLDFDEEDLSQPVLQKEKVNSIDTTNNIVTKVKDVKLKPIPTNNDDKSNVLQKNKSIKTPDLIDSTVPKPTEKVYKLSTESPSNGIDITDPLEEYNNIGGFTMEDVAIVKPKDKPPSTTIDEIPKNLSDGESKKKLVDKFGSNSYNDLLGSSLDFDEEDLSQPELQKEKVNSMDTTNNIVTKVKDEKLKPIPTNNDDNSNVLQKNKSIKTPDLIDSTVPKSTENVYKLSTESPSNGIDITDPLEEYNNLGGFTMEDVAIEKLKDKPPSTTIDEIPKNLSDGERKKKLVDKLGSNSYNDLLGSSLDFDEEDLSQPGLKKKKVIPIATTNDVIIKNGEDNKLNPLPTNNDDKSIVLQKNKSIKTPDLIDSTVPKSTEKVYKLSTESPSNGIDITDPLEEYNNLGGFTMEDVAIEKLKDKPPSTTIDEIPKNLSDGERKKKLVDKLGSNSYNDLLGSSLDFDEEDLSQPGLKKKKVIPIATTNDVIIKNGEDNKLNPLPTNNDDKSNVLQKNKSIKTPDLIDSTVPKSTEKVYKLSTQSPLNGIDITDPLEEYNNLGGFTLEDVAIEHLKDKPPFSTLNNNGKVDYDDSLQVTNQPMLMKPNTEYKSGVHTNIEEFPKNLSGSHEKIMLDDKINSNANEYILGNSIGFDKLEFLQPKYKYNNVNRMSKSGNILLNVDDVTLKSTPVDNYINSNILQKNKLKPVSNTASKILDLIEPTSQTNYDIIRSDNNLPMLKIPSNIIDKHSSNSNSMHNYNHNLLNNVKDVTFNRNFITNPSVEFNSNDLSSLEDGDRYGYMLPKFSTTFREGGESNYNLWETIPPKKNSDVSLNKGYVNLINDFNQSSGYTTKNNKISSHTLNENNIVTGTDRVKNIYNYDKVNADIYKKQYDDLIKKIDNIDDKLAKLDKVSHNCSYMREISIIGSHEPTMSNVLLSNDIPITKPQKVINIEDSYSKTNKPIGSHEINTSNKSDDENEINKNETPKAKKHKNKIHKIHGRHNKKKVEKNNTSYNGDDDDDDVDDDDDDDDDDDNDNDNDDCKHKKNKRLKNKDINNDDDGKHKKNKHHKKNKKIDDNNDNGGHRKKSHKKKKSKVDDDIVSKHKKHKSHKKKDSKIDDDVVSKHKKHKSHKKKYRNDNDVEILRSKKTDNKKKKKIKEDVYLPEESNDVNYSSSIQINSENNDSVKGLKTTRIKSKISKKTNSTKSKKSSPKKKSKYVKHSKTIKYKNKEIPVDVSDDNTSSNENNYNLEKTYIKYISNNNKNNVPKNKKYKHKKHNEHLKTNKTYVYKNIPEDNVDKDSDENNVNLEETYNINIISDDNAPRQKKHRHKKKKNFDINIVKDTDTQVLNNDKKTQNGFQFYALYPQYRYATLNPFARLITNSYL